MWGCSIYHFKAESWKKKKKKNRQICKSNSTLGHMCNLFLYFFDSLQVFSVYKMHSPKVLVAESRGKNSSKFTAFYKVTKKDHLKGAMKKLPFSFY